MYVIHMGEAAPLIGTKTILVDGKPYQVKVYGSVYPNTPAPMPVLPLTRIPTFKRYKEKLPATKKKTAKPKPKADFDIPQSLTTAQAEKLSALYLQVINSGIFGMRQKQRHEVIQLTASRKAELRQAAKAARDSSLHSRSKWGSVLESLAKLPIRRAMDVSHLPAVEYRRLVSIVRTSRWTSGFTFRESAGRLIKTGKWVLDEQRYS